MKKTVDMKILEITFSPCVAGSPNSQMLLEGVENSGNIVLVKIPPPINDPMIKTPFWTAPAKLSCH